MQFTTPFTIAAGLLTGGALLASVGASSDFDDPQCLSSGDSALGGKVRYPSPRLMDVDGDGAREMIVGDLTGLVRVAKPQAVDDDLAWGELAPLITDGRELKFNNW